MSPFYSPCISRTAAVLCTSPKMYQPQVSIRIRRKVAEHFSCYLRTYGDNLQFTLSLNQSSLCMHEFFSGIKFSTGSLCCIGWDSKLLRQSPNLPHGAICCCWIMKGPLTMTNSLSLARAMSFLPSLPPPPAKQQKSFALGDLVRWIRGKPVALMED